MLKNNFSLFLTSCLLIFSLPAQGGTTLADIQKNGVLKVGIREDAIPFGYRDSQGNFSGLCIDFIALLKQRILTELDQNIITIKLINSNLFNRFRLVEDKVVHIECGPNTIREVPDYGINFSNPFFVTGTQFLLKTSQLDNFNLDTDLVNVSLGVMQDSSTQNYLEATYPQANLVLFQGSTGRSRGVQAVKEGEITAMISDGILLLGEAINQGLNLNEDYTLLPNNPLTCDQYGMIIPQQDAEWENLVNSVIDEFKTTENEWITVIGDYFEQVETYCGTQR